MYVKRKNMLTLVRICFSGLGYFRLATAISILYETNYHLYLCLESHGQFFSYLATAIITGDRAANLDLRLALTAFSSEGSFTCHTYWDTGPPFLKSCLKDLWFSLLSVVLMATEQSLPILNVLGLTRLVRAVLKLTTSCLTCNQKNWWLQ
jgi:hypothetical protein